MLYKAMLDHGVFMEGTILKSNMVNPGAQAAAFWLRSSRKPQGEWPSHPNLVVTTLLP